MTQHSTHDDEMKLHTLLSEMHTDAQPVNLRMPRARPDLSCSSDAPTEVDARVSPAFPSGSGSGSGSAAPAARRGAKRERAHPTAARSEGSTSMPLDDDDPSVRREHHNKHTRKCRARLKGKFDAVLDMLPDPAPSQEVKHKVQVLDYAMQTFRALGAELSELEMTLALHSHRNLLRWVDTFARKEQDLSAALLPFLDIFCTKRDWVYAEIWHPAHGDPSLLLPLQPPRLHAHAAARGAADGDGDGDGDDDDDGGDDGASDMFVERFVVKQSPWCSKHMTDKLALLGDRFARNQELVPRSDAQLARTVHALQPQVATGLSSSAGAGGGSPRARVLAEAGIGTSMLVPVVVDAQVVRVVAFYDIRERQVDADTKRLAVFIATSIGNAHNAAVHERSIKNKQLAGPSARAGPSNRAGRA